MTLDKGMVIWYIDIRLTTRLPVFTFSVLLLQMLTMGRRAVMHMAIYVTVTCLLYGTYCSYRFVDTNRTTLLRSVGEKCKHRLPKAIIIGLAMCGTVALTNFLSYHPQISAIPAGVELRFFTTYYYRGLEWYRKSMNWSLFLTWSPGNLIWRTLFREVG